MEFDYTSSNPNSHSSSTSNTAPPLSIKEIAEKATRFDYNPLIPLRYWLRTADTLLKESNIYLSEGDEQQAYLLLIRWTELVLQYLPTHPERYIPENRHNLQRAHARAPDALRTLEHLKPRLEARYNAYVERQAAKQAARQQQQQQQLQQPAMSRLGSTMSSLSSRKQGTPGALNLSKRMSASSLKGPFSPPLKSAQRTDLDGNLALEIARQEFEKRERQKRERRRLAALESGREIPLDSTGAEIRRISTPTAATFSPRHIVYASPPSASYNGGFREELEAERKQREALEDEEALIESVKALSMGVDLEPQQQTRGRHSYYPSSNNRDSISAYDFDGFPEYPSERDTSRREEPSIGRWTGSYPTVPRRQHSPTRLTAPPITLHHHRDPTPPRPPKHAYPEPLPDYLDTTISPPALPPKVPDRPSHTHTPSPSTPVTKQFSTPATLEDGTALRTMFLPASLRSTFLQIAHPNTAANLETCGILCGTLIQNALFVSRLVIPEQEATSDTCATKDEEGLFEYCDKEDLMVLGWIHTHPTQTCFMSSVDLHTHAGYQLMMRESVAIVCAPSKRPSWGVFRLTDPPGVQTIVNCRQGGLFHPHGEESVYTDAMRPGHVCEVKDMGFDVVDLRK
ncbi:hypothetical protein K440DRAFT_597928, partial [Wilcoxina mikolae CBS 423.85]